MKSTKSLVLSALMALLPNFSSALGNSQNISSKKLTATALGSGALGFGGGFVTGLLALPHKDLNNLNELRKQNGEKEFKDYIEIEQAFIDQSKRENDLMTQNAELKGEKMKLEKKQSEIELELLQLRQTVTNLQLHNEDKEYEELVEKTKKYVESVKKISDLIDKEVKVLEDACKNGVVIDKLFDVKDKSSSLTKYLNGKCPPEMLNSELGSNLKNIKNLEIAIGLGNDRFLP